MAINRIDPSAPTAIQAQQAQMQIDDLRRRLDSKSDKVSWSKITDKPVALSSIAMISGTGIVVKTDSTSYQCRTITGTANQIIVTNGDGVSAVPVLSLPQNIHAGASPSFAGLTLSALAAGTTDSVLVEDGGVVKKRTINTKVWGTSLGDSLISLAVFSKDTEVGVSDGETGIPISDNLAGKDLTKLFACVATVGTGSTTDVIVRRRRAGAEVYMLNTASKIVGGAYYAEDGVPDPGNDDLLIGDTLFVDVTNVNTVAPKGLSVTLFFE